MQRLKQSTAFVFQPQQVMMDYEQGAIKAFTEEFPDIVVKGCHFHFTQSIWRRIQELGLVTVYKEDQVVRAWLQKFKSLAFVTIDLVETAFNYLISLQPDSPHKILLILVFMTEITYHLLFLTNNFVQF